MIVARVALGSTASRSSGCWHVHFAPAGASWLNQAERFFAMLTEKQLRRGTHRSTHELEQPSATTLAPSTPTSGPYGGPSPPPTSSSPSNAFACAPSIPPTGSINSSKLQNQDTLRPKLKMPLLTQYMPEMHFAVTTKQPSMRERLPLNTGSIWRRPYRAPWRASGIRCCPRLH